MKSPVPTTASATPTRSPSEPIANEQGSKGKTKKQHYRWFGLAAAVGILGVAVTWLGANANTVFNFFLVLFTYLLYKVGDRQTALLEETGRLATEAEKLSRAISKESLEVTKLTAQSTRPYLLVDKAELLGVMKPRQLSESNDIFQTVGELINKPDQFLETNKFLPQARLTFKNFGKGLAAIKEFVGLIDLVAELPPVKDFQRCRPIKPDREVIGPDGELREEGGFISVPLGLNEKALSEIRDRAKTLVVYGRIKYSDVTDTGNYETGFFWIFDAPQKQIVAEFQFMTPSKFIPDPARNYRT